MILIIILILVAVGFTWHFANLLIQKSMTARTLYLRSMIVGGLWGLLSAISYLGMVGGYVPLPLWIIILTFPTFVLGLIRTPTPIDNFFYSLPSFLSIIIGLIITTLVGFVIIMSLSLLIMKIKSYVLLKKK